MKRIFIFVSFLAVAFAAAVDKPELGKAIRSLDVDAVEKIIGVEKFSPNEYQRYLALAEEMVRNRETWTIKWINHDDITTPYNGPSIIRLGVQGFLAYHGLIGGSMCLAFLTSPYSVSFYRQPMKNGERALLATGFVFSAALTGNFILNLKNRFFMDKEHNKLLRKKYDDAITIKQLIYTADVAES